MSRSSGRRTARKTAPSCVVVNVNRTLLTGVVNPRGGRAGLRLPSRRPRSGIYILSRVRSPECRRTRGAGMLGTQSRRLARSCRWPGWPVTRKSDRTGRLGTSSQPAGNLYRRKKNRSPSSYMRRTARPWGTRSRPRIAVTNGGGDGCAAPAPRCDLTLTYSGFRGFQRLGSGGRSSQSRQASQVTNSGRTVVSTSSPRATPQTALPMMTLKK